MTLDESIPPMKDRRYPHVTSASKIPTQVGSTFPKLASISLPVPIFRWWKYLNPRVSSLLRFTFHSAHFLNFQLTIAKEVTGNSMECQSVADAIFCRWELEASADAIAIASTSASTDRMGWRTNCEWGDRNGKLRQAEPVANRPPITKVKQPRRGPFLQSIWQEGEQSQRQRQPAAQQPSSPAARQPNPS